MTEQSIITNTLNGLREESSIGSESAMAVEHWAQATRILYPDATDEQVRIGLDDYVSRGLMKFEPDIEITTIGGHKRRIDGYYRSAP